MYDDSLDHSESILLLLAFIIGVVAIVYSAMIHYPFQREIIYLLISQLLLVLFGNFFSKWNSIQVDKSRFAFYFIKIFACLAAIGLVSTLLLKYIQFTFFAILQLFALLFTKATEPLLNFLQYLLNKSQNEGKKSNLQGSNGLGEAEKYQDQSYGMTENILYILLLLGAVGFIIYLFYKKKFNSQTLAANSSSLVEISKGGFGPNQFSNLPRRGKPPEDLIRREIFNLERFAHKLKLGRFPFETLEEWWQRLGIKATPESNEIYEKVRYGGIISSNVEQTHLKTEIHHIKKQLKEIYKGRKI